LVKRLRQGARPGLVLICLPYAGASAAVFHSWRRYLSPLVELYAVDLPGRGRLIGHPPITEMSELVSELASAVTPHLSDPFAVFGHSMGALATRF
jgi:medium-chain acyl-[acyl-carrier-protein] hydrolase